MKSLFLSNIYYLSNEINLKKYSISVDVNIMIINLKNAYMEDETY